MSHPANGGRRNRLAQESSPYLLLHATNPVDWYPWGDEAFERARREDKPIFLSVGYSTCYWCHVMEREVFSNEDIARQMNEGFVSIKLDREERPDVDEIYMMATQLLTRSGGWPNSVFLDHELQPFFAGTYFPPQDWHGRPGFPRILQSVREAWALRRTGVQEQARILARAIREQLAARGSGRAPDRAVVVSLQSALARRFDPEWGGFGGAPKFPSPSNLFFLLDRARSGDVEARGMLVTTLDRMARGGIQDHVGGGFHRYSTDAEWLVPHFEKMLYDNAALARLYAEAHELSPEDGFGAVARRTLDFVLRELTSAEGGFLSAIDAETDGHEGAYYVWTRRELREVLGEDDAFAATILGADSAPNFEDDHYVLHLPQPLRKQAEVMGLDPSSAERRLESACARLLAARVARQRPLVDDKIMTDWNGLMIGTAARAGAVLKEPRYVTAARQAAEFVLDRLFAGGELKHTYRAGHARVAAMLDDYAFLVSGLLDLYAATNEARFLEAARAIQARQDERLWDEEQGGYFAAPADPRLLVRAKPATDGAVASGNGVSALNLLRLAALEGGEDPRRRAERTVAAFAAAVEELPLAYVTLVQAIAALTAVGAPAAPVTEPAAETGMAATALAVVEARGRFEKGATGEWRPFRVDLMIRSGWHVNANRPSQSFLVPTTIQGEVRNVRYPEAERMTAQFAADPIDVYSGFVTIEGEARADGGGPVTLRLEYQACDEGRCLAPVTKEVVVR